MMTVIDQSNCLILHEFADRYDCPALKLTAWRMIQESTPAYAAMPSLLFESVSALVSPGSGLTGPAETFQHHLRGEIDEEEELPSILNPLENDFIAGEGVRGGYPQPDELPPDASAIDVVRAWAFRLQDVYEQCNPHINDTGERDGLYGDIDWRSELRDIYNVLNMPDKIVKIDQILDLYKGKEDQMIQSILFKYKDVLPAEYTYRLTDLAIGQ
jgi:hypothetical protein